MIDAHELIEDIWARYNSRYNNRDLYSKEEIQMAKMVLEDVQSAINFFDRNGKYRWHDLRKDPNDLPKDNEIRNEYMVTDGNQYFISKYFGKGEYFNGCWEYPEGVFECNAYDIDVIAWREI